MAGQHVEGTHAVLVLDEEGRVLSNHWPVQKAEVAALVMRMRAEHVGARILIDGNIASVMPMVPAPLANPDAALTLSASPAEAPDLAQLSHHMLWATFERAASVQAWMLQQANVFTKDLLANSRKLADQASAMQNRFQQAMQQINLMETEKKLMEHELMTRRLSRHQLGQERAEDAAARPRGPADTGWIEDLISGIGSIFTTRPPDGTGEKN